MITLQNYSFFLKKQKITSSFTNIYANFAVRITNKINLFRDYICKEPPANWEQFFKELENRCKPMKAPQKKYTLLQIPAGNKELQRIILTNHRDYTTVPDPYYGDYSDFELVITLLEDACQGLLKTLIQP